MFVNSAKDAVILDIKLIIDLPVDTGRDEI